MKVHEIFKKVREYEGKTQEWVAKSVGITHPPLSGFETGKYSLSIDTKMAIAQLLDLNPKIVTEPSTYPFNNPTGIIKMYATEGVSKSLLDPLYFVADFCQKIELICLRAAPAITKNTFIKLGIPWIFALTFRDDQGNIFLLRGKNEKNLINFALAFPDFIFKIQKSKCVFSIAQKESDKDLLDRIREWDNLSREDIERLFHEVDFDEVNKKWTGNEEKQMTSQRSLQMDALSDLDLIIIKSMRAEKVSHDEMLKFIKSKSSPINGKT